MLDEPRELTGVPQESLREGWRTILALFLCTLALFGVSIIPLLSSRTRSGLNMAGRVQRSGGAVSAMWLTAPVNRSDAFHGDVGVRGRLSMPGY